MLKFRIKRLKRSMKTNNSSIFINLEEKRELDRLHDQFALIPVDKAGNNILFVPKVYYLNCNLEKFRFLSACGNPTFTNGSFSKEEIL